MMDRAAHIAAVIAGKVGGNVVKTFGGRSRTIVQDADGVNLTPPADPAATIHHPDELQGFMRWLEDEKSIGLCVGGYAGHLTECGTSIESLIAEFRKSRDDNPAA